MGNFYQFPSAKTSAKPRIQNSAAATPMPVSDEASKGPAAPAAAAQKGAQGTKGMKASLGRTVYVGGQGFQEVPDPGAHGLAELLLGLSEGLKK